MKQQTSIYTVYITDTYAYLGTRIVDCLHIRNENMSFILQVIFILHIFYIYKPMFSQPVLLICRPHSFNCDRDSLSLHSGCICPTLFRLPMCDNGATYTKDIYILQPTFKLAISYTYAGYIRLPMFAIYLAYSYIYTTYTHTPHPGWIGIHVHSLDSQTPHPDWICLHLYSLHSHTPHPDWMCPTLYSLHSHTPHPGCNVAYI